LDDPQNLLGDGPDFDFGEMEFDLEDKPDKVIDAGIISPVVLQESIQQDPLPDLPMPSYPEWITSKSAPADLVSALPRFNGELSFYIQLFDDFIEHLIGRVEELNKQVSENNSTGVSRSGHNLKGVAANFNAYRLKQFGERLEIEGKNGDLSHAQEWIQGIEQEIPILKNYVQNLKEFSMCDVV
jgi:HPt (histidine-containing phosphotransfer) domain-containing protein